MIILFYIFIILFLISVMENSFLSFQTTSFLNDERDALYENPPPESSCPIREGDCINYLKQQIVFGLV